MKTSRLVILVSVLLASLAAAQPAPPPPPPAPPPPAGPPPTAELRPKISSAKPGLTDRATIQVRGTLPGSGYKISAQGAFSADTKIAQITIAMTPPPSGGSKALEQEFSLAVPIAELKPYKGEFTIVVASPSGKELHRFDKASK
ncbi:MAG: hypothetical protein AB7O24_15945 [Kofleriaceae bacterium]